MRNINKIIVHWSASHTTTTVENIKKWHLQNGWRDIGYHRIILYPTRKESQWSDLVKLGRDIELAGAHTKGHNKDSIGICVIGNTNYNLHRLQKEALIKTLDILTERYKIPKSEVYGHRDFMATQCCGDQIYDVVQNYKKQ